MRKSSIHFRKVAGSSEAHNTRQVKPDYLLNFDDNIVRHKSVMESSIEERRAQIEAFYEAKVGQKVQAKMNPIREAVLNLHLKHVIGTNGKVSTLEPLKHLKRLSDALNAKYGITCFQTHVHNDEGKSHKERNWHAHLVFDWQNKTTGRMISLSKKDLSEIQTLTAEVLGMERGELWSKAERLEHGEFRAKKNELEAEIAAKEKKISQLDQTVGQKKNQLDGIRKNLEPIYARGVKLDSHLREAERIEKEINEYERKISRLVETKRTGNATT